MKKNIHPKVYNDCVVTCVCKNVFTTISTEKTLAVEVCSNCHPLFTGTQKFVDTEGRIDKFNKKLVQTAEKVQEHKAKIESTKSKKQQSTTNQKAPSLSELMKQVKEEETSEKPQE
jgi:large subunit ribosomal protein L31